MKKKNFTGEEVKILNFSESLKDHVLAKIERAKEFKNKLKLCS